MPAMLSALILSTAPKVQTSLSPVTVSPSPRRPKRLSSLTTSWAMLQDLGWQISETCG